MAERSRSLVPKLSLSPVLTFLLFSRGTDVLSIRQVEVSARRCWIPVFALHGSPPSGAHCLVHWWPPRRARLARLLAEIQEHRLVQTEDYRAVQEHAG